MAQSHRQGGDIVIREATMEDLSALVDFCFECEASMHWQAHGLGGERSSVIATLVKLIECPDALTLVVEVGGSIEGACAVALQGFSWNRSLSIASEMIWHMRPSFPEGPAKNRWLLRLMDRAQSWVKQSGATVFKVNTRWDDLPLGSALERRGFAPFELVFLQGVNHGD